MSDIYCSFSIPLASILTVTCGWYHAISAAATQNSVACRSFEKSANKI